VRLSVRDFLFRLVFSPTIPLTQAQQIKEEL